MKKKLLLLVVFATLLVAVGCSSSPMNGTWEEEGTGLLLMFSGNTITYGKAGEAGAVASFVYDEEASTITITIEAPGGTDVETTLSYEIVDKVLTLTDDAGNSTKYTKQ